MNRFMFSLLFVLSILCNSCRNSIDGHQYIRFVNNTENDIYVDVGSQYPDTLFDAWNVIFNNSEDYYVPAKSTRDCLKQLNKGTWEAKIKHFRSDTLIVFILDFDSLNRICSDKTIDWSNFSYSRDLLPLNEKIVLTRYYYTRDHLDSMNWTITYP